MWNKARTAGGNRRAIRCWSWWTRSVSRSQGIGRSGASGRGGEKGVTLTEMLVVLAIISIFAFITIPAFRDFMNAFRVKATAFQIRDVMRLGRQIAVAKKSLVVAQVGEDDDTYDAWEDDDEDTVKDAGEESVRPVPPVHEFVDITHLRSNAGPLPDPATFILNSDGTIERNGCADPCAESQWCVQVEMQINSQRRDRWTVFIKQSGKVDLRFNEDPTDANYCKW